MTHIIAVSCALALWALPAAAQNDWLGTWEAHVDQVEHYVFYDKNGREVTQAKYDKLSPSFQGSIDTLRINDADWIIIRMTFKVDGTFQIREEFIANDGDLFASLDEMLAAKLELDSINAFPAVATMTYETTGTYGIDGDTMSWEADEQTLYAGDTEANAFFAAVASQLAEQSELPGDIGPDFVEEFGDNLGRVQTTSGSYVYQVENGSLFLSRNGNSFLQASWLSSIVLSRVADGTAVTPTSWGSLKATKQTER